ncbi:TonB-dependent receptor [Pedobacter heparinus]|uniref:TonB-dependent receptor n=1 Tax=Pedobacter heparinus TaxID=984 RepID=UPI002931342B|nr:TonB-dependent receptor [Pedobacter heparinus]
MRLATIILIVTMLQVSAASYGQYVTMRQKNATLDQLFQTIRKQTGYSVLFVTDKIKGSSRINVDFNNLSIEKVLDQVLSGRSLTYLINDRTIIIKPRQRLIEDGYPSYVMAEVKGSVVDETGKPLHGVSVKIKNNTGGTITDANGQFVLNAPKDAVLVFSYVGYEVMEINIENQTDLQVKLKAVISALDEIIVVSYGKQRSREITGSIAQVDASTLRDMPVGQFAQQLQGKVAGVQISQVTGQPGRGMDFRIRGAASLFAGSNPLFVIDGIPITGSINNINPAEIETFTVLKDASATALYGSRASNGVILITTKHAKPGDARVTVDSYYGIQKIPENKVPKVMNARQFAEYMKGRYEDQLKYEPETKPTLSPLYANPEEYGEGTNWYKVITRTAPVQSHNISILSAGEKSSSAAIVGYQEQQGVLINTGTKLYSLRLNHDLNIGNKLKIGFNLAPSYRIDHNNRINTDGLDGIFMYALEASPLGVPVNPDGSYPVNVNSPGMANNVNPYTRLTKLTDDHYTTRILANAYASYEVLKDLTIKTSLAVDKGAETNKTFSPSVLSSTGIALGNSGSADNYAWTSETNLQYNKSFKEHHIEVLAGYSAQKYTGLSNALAGQGFASDEIPYLNAATIITSGSSGAAGYSMLSAIGRINYNYKGKYLLSGAIRSDGSSRFGPNKKYGYFPSVSAGWILSDEAFMANATFIDFLKVRASYGITGNNNIGNYTYISTIGSNINYFANGVLYPGATVNSLGNDDLAWERNKQFDLGFDLAILNRRITIGYDYYQKITDGMIQNRPIPQASGFSSIRFNVGEFDFWGHEISIGSSNLTGKLKWNSNLVVSIDRNRIRSLVSPGYIDAASTPTAGYYRNQIGQRLGLFYGFVFKGLYKDDNDLANSAKYIVGSTTSDVGTIKFEDVNGDGVIENVNDRKFIGDPTPDFTFGFTNNFTYKNFDLNISMAGQIGGDLLNVNKWTHLVNMDGARNLLADASNRWRSPENPGSGEYPRTKTNTTALGRYSNSQWVEKGTYLTVKNISFGYTFNLLQAKQILKGLRVFAAVQQAFIFTGYSGMNPEANLSGLDAARGIGIDANAYPVPRTFSLGLSANFK